MKATLALAGLLVGLLGGMRRAAADATPPPLASGEAAMEATGGTLPSVGLVGPFPTLEAYCARNPRYLCERHRAALAKPATSGWLRDVAVIHADGALYLGLRLAKGWYVDEETELHTSVNHGRGDAVVTSATLEEGRLVVRALESDWHKGVEESNQFRYDEYACFEKVVVCGVTRGEPLCTRPVVTAGTLHCGDELRREHIKNRSRWEWRLSVKLVDGGRIDLRRTADDRLPLRMPRGYGGRLDDLPASTRRFIGTHRLPFATP